MSKPKAKPAGHDLSRPVADEDAVCLHSFKDGARPQARKVGEEAFDAAKKRVFLETLRRTANITRSAKVAGVAVSTAYRHRARYPFFMEAWMEALIHAVDVLETTMLERALRYNASLSEAGREEGEPELTIEPFSNGDAMRLIKLHRETIAERRAEIIARKQSRPEAVRERLAEKLYAIHDRLMAREKALNDAPV
jgi:hypothetical protein